MPDPSASSRTRGASRLWTLDFGHRTSIIPPLSGLEEVPMRWIAVMNQKGGVGKTTTAVNLSAALAAAGKRVFLVDLDPQAHASLHLGVTIRDGEKSTYDVLAGSSGFAEVRREVGDRLWLAPAYLDLAAAAAELAGE